MTVIDEAASLDDILQSVQAYLPDADVGVIAQAYLFGAAAHAGQRRKSGEDYYIHPIAVAGILASLRMDVDTIAVGLLHDTVEDCLSSLEEIGAEFGQDVSEMVEGVTKIGKLEFRTKHEAQAENFRKLVLAMAKDVRVILVKLADRLHNMRTMEHMKADRQRAISQETMDIYAPIANRLGLSRLKMELEDLCLRYLRPDVYEELSEKLALSAAERTAFVDSICTDMRRHLEERKVAAVVKGRPKHLTSVWRKMRTSGIAFEQIHDLHALRVLVDDIGACYTVLGWIHARYRHIPDRLKDYIAQPKSNGYQSLHTVILTEDGRQVEVQIRTHEMHRVAEFGIAAHWRYKEGHLALSRDDVNKIARLRSLFEAAQEVEDSEEFLETIKVDLFNEEVFAFTPNGDVHFFPNGATVLDFAYAIHTAVGDTCTGALVNGRMVSVRTELRSGDRVEIIRNKEQKPNRDWLQVAKTGRALSKIRRSLREGERAEGKRIGRELLAAELQKRGHKLEKKEKAGEIEKAASHFGHRDPELLYLAIAQGNISARKVLQQLLPADQVDEATTGLAGLFNRFRRKSQSPVLITGESDILVNYAKCCNPLPGEPVRGYITQGRGITVHHASCKQLLTLDPQRRIRVDWSAESAGRHTGELRIVTSNQAGMLAEVGGICKALEINVSRMEARELADGNAEFTLAVNVADVTELTQLMRKLEQVGGIHRVDRVRAS
jgi:GTP pyrophosphokinase